MLNLKQNLNLQFIYFIYLFINPPNNLLFLAFENYFYRCFIFLLVKNFISFNFSSP